MIAPAKINLGLWILRRRPDGYHDLLTVFQAIDLFDDLLVSVTDRPELRLTTDHPGIPIGEENLVIRAARLLRAEAIARMQRVAASARFSTKSGAARQIANRASL